MTKLPRLLATTVVLAMPLALGACGSSGSSAAGASPHASGSAPAGTADTGHGSADEPSHDHAKKPSKDEVVQGLIKFYAAQGTSGDPASKLANCITTKGYRTLSPKTLQAMKDGKPKQIDPKDTAKFTQIAGTCATAGATG